MFGIIKVMSEESNHKRSLDTGVSKEEGSEPVSAKRLKQSEAQWNETIDEIAEIITSK